AQNDAVTIVAGSKLVQVADRLGPAREFRISKLVHISCRIHPYVPGADASACVQNNITHPCNLYPRVDPGGQLIPSPGHYRLDFLPRLTEKESLQSIA